VGLDRRPADNEKYGLVHSRHYLLGYHGAVPPVALIAPFARVAGSTNRSARSMTITRCRLQNVTAAPGVAA
jgi:hypothetical protein